MSSAGKKSSTINSSNVTSRGVPNVVRVVNMERTAGPISNLKGISGSGSSSMAKSPGCDRSERLGYPEISSSIASRPASPVSCMDRRI